VGAGLTAAGALAADEGATSSEEDTSNPPPIKRTKSLPIFGAMPTSPSFAGFAAASRGRAGRDGPVSERCPAFEDAVIVRFAIARKLSATPD
jgi:hypothetical protein